MGLSFDYTFTRLARAPSIGVRVVVDRESCDPSGEFERFVHCPGRLAEFLTDISVSTILMI